MLRQLGAQITHELGYHVVPVSSEAGLSNIAAPGDVSSSAS